MRILFTSYGGGHVTAILPVLKAMQQRGHDCRYLALTTAGEAASREGIEHTRPIDYVDLQNSEIADWGARLAQRHHTDGKGISIDESIAYLGVSFMNLASILGVEEAWRRYEISGLNAFCPVAFMREVLAREKPGVVVATSSPRMEMAALRAAYQLRIPSLCMIELFGIQEEPWLSRPDNGHVVSISRPDVKRRLIAAGRCGDEIYLTGSPMFDRLDDPTLPAVGREWRRQHDVGDHEVLVFWAEQPEPPNPELPRRVRAHLARVCEKNSWRLVIRLHPSSTDPRGEVIPPGCLQSHGDENLAHVIHACDIGITLTSTVGWELMLAGKPLIVISISSYSDLVTYGQDDGALAVSSLDLVEEGIKKILSGGAEAQRLAAQRQQLPPPGKATGRICELLESEVVGWLGGSGSTARRLQP